uniref:NADH-ubiquinone oxidoreductase chain 6 n=2 Tax=Bradypus TaxID=9353 RepID=A0A140AU08_BRAVA|nr:NADH dehydrogenase subunit 6 [Bradypus pygmaeus]ALF62855.1 NADH dehydrogenase subunit 6 [Bradypus variegatus]ALO62194.1 NADH dehydrogenase subunit 6 [Bradypus pygmaeus]
MMYVMYMLSVVFVVGFVGFSCKPSPIYGGLGLVVGGGVGCGMVVGFGGSFLGLVVFLVYLGGMLVVFGYTTAMAIEEYPEVWGSNVVVFGGLLVGLLVEGLVVVLFLVNSSVEFMFCSFECMGDWVIFGGGGEGFVREDYVGVSSLYSYGIWFVIMAGWALFISVFVVVEVTRGG